jgi:organic radical activating enzyme
MFHKDIWPLSKEISIDRWMTIIYRLYGVREIVLTGGEPMLYSFFPELCNFILDQGYFLMVFSNLQSKKGLQVKPHKNYMIYASHHLELTEKGEQTWQNNYKLYAERYNVRVDQLGKDKKVLSKEEEYANCYLKPRFTIDATGGFHFNLLSAMKTYHYPGVSK